MNFFYQAKDAKGLHIEGKIDAPSEDQAILLLHQKGVFVISLGEVESKGLNADMLSFFNKATRKDLIIFTRQLATLIDADVPLLEAFAILAHQTEKESFKKVIIEVQAAVEGGSALSVALADHEEVFDKFFTSLIRVGEVTGKLQDTLLYLADYLERSGALTSKIRGAIFYPAFVLVSMVVVTIIMMTTVIPQLLGIIRDSGVTELPLPTRILIAVSGFFSSYYLFIIIVGILSIVGLYYYVRTQAGRLQWDALKIAVPKFGTIVRNLYLARIAETLSTLIRSGVPILEGLEITSHVVGNEVYKAILLEAKQNVQAGGTISQTLAEHKEFPKLVSSMLSTGERTGRTDYMLANILKFYKTEAEQSVQNLSQLIEPILILVLGLGVGVLVSAILLPIYSLVNVT